MEKHKRKKFSKKKGPPHVIDPCSGQGNMPPWMRGQFPDDMSWGNEFPGMRGPFPDEMCGPGRGGPPHMGGPFPDEMCGPGRGWPPHMGGPFPDEMCGPWRGRPPHMGGPFPDEICGPGRGGPPHMRGPFPDEMCGPGRGGPPHMGGPFPDEMCGPGRDGPPHMGGPFPDEMCGPGRDGPPHMGGPFPDEMCGPGRDGPPHMGGPFPDEMCGPVRGGPPYMDGPFPDEMCGPGRGGPPHMGGPFPDEMCGPRRGGPPRMGGPFPDEMCGPGRGGPPHMGGPFPDEMCGPGRGGPPHMGGHFPDERCGPGRGGPPHMGGPFPEERGGPPHMRGPFPEEMCGPPHMGGPFPEQMCGPRGGMPPRMRGPFLHEMQEPEGNMRPWMRGPCPDDMVGHRGNMPPERRGHCWAEEWEAEGNLPPPRNGPQTPDLWPSRSVPAPEGDLHQPASFGVRLQQRDACGPFCSDNESLPRGKSSSEQLPASGKEEKCSTSVHGLYLQEGAARILETFGLSSEDLDELCRYPDDQLKPENMPTILEDIRKRKRAGPSLSLPSGRDGLCVPPVESEVSMAVQPTVPEPLRLLDSSEAEKMKNCPNPSVLNDYYSVTPKVFPHTCSMCKIECRHLKGWSLHLSTTVHSESCHQLCQQYPNWNPEDSFWLKRYRGGKNAHHPERRRSASSSLERSGCSRPRTRSRSRSPRLDRTSQPRTQSPSQALSPTRPPAGAQPSQAAAQPKETEHPGSKTEHPGELSKDLDHLEQPKGRAAGQEQHCREESEEGKKPLSNTPQSALSSLVEKSVVQAMSLFHPGGAVTAGLGQGASLASLPPVQLDPEAVSKGLVSMMQMVATQVVQAVLASREASSGQVSSDGPGVIPQPKDSSCQKEEEKQNEEQEEEQQQGVPSISPQPEGERAGPLLGTSWPAAGGGVPSEPSTSARRVMQTAKMPHGEARSGVDGEEENREDGVLDLRAPLRDGERGASQEMVRYQPGLSQHGHARVVICGHDYVFWAAKYAARTSWGQNLGLGAQARLEWRGQKGMLWDGFSEFASQSSPEVPPAILVIHLGGNDLTRTSGKSLILRVIADLRSFKLRFPETRLVWSALTPRLVWVSARDPRQVDRARKGINREVARAVQEGLGSVIWHPEIVISHPELYREDGIHLSDLGLNLFLNDLQGGLKAELVGLVGEKEHTE